MMHKPLFSQITKRIKRADHGLSDPRLIHSGRDWGVGLSVAFIIFGVSAVWGVQTYFELKDASVNETEPVAEEIVYRESLVKAALSEFETRRSTHDELMKQTVITEEIPESSEESSEVVVENEGEGEEGVIGESPTTTTTDVIQDGALSAPPEPVAPLTEE